MWVRISILWIFWFLYFEFSFISRCWHYVHCLIMMPEVFYLCSQKHHSGFCNKFAETNGCASATANKWKLQKRVLAEYLPSFIAWILIKKITFSSLLSSCSWYMPIFLPHTTLDHIIFTCSSCLLLNTLCWFHAVLFHPLFNPPLLFSFSCFESALLWEQSCMAELFPERVSIDGSLKGQQRKGKLPVPLLKSYVQSAT